MNDTAVDSTIQTRGGKPNWLNRTLLRQTGKLSASKEDSTKALTHIAVKNSSLVMFVLMPFVAILLLLFYYRRGRYYYEHLIFSIHIHTIIFLLFSLTLAATYYTNEAVTDSVLSWLLLICWIYFLLSLKHVYQQGWLKTILKFLLLSFSYLFVAVIFTTGALLWGFITF